MKMLILPANVHEILVGSFLLWVFVDKETKQVYHFVSKETLSKGCIYGTRIS